MEINGITNLYTVQSGDTLDDIATALAALVDVGNSNVSAEAVSDRITFRQAALGVSGSSIVYNAESSIGTAAVLTVCAYTPDGNFLETENAARRRITATGVINTGDQLRLAVTRLDGMTFTNTVIAGGGDTLATLFDALRDAVSGDPNLQGPDGCFMADPAALSGGQRGFYVFARTNGWNSYNIHLDYVTIGLGGSYNGELNSNQDTLSARGMLFLSQGLDPLIANYSLDTTLLPDGPHTLRLVAYEGTAVKTQGRKILPFVVSNNNLSCTISNPAAGAHILISNLVNAVVSSAHSGGTVTSIQVYVEGKLFSETNAASANVSWDSADYGEGFVTVQAKAFSDDGFEALSDLVTVHIYNDNDGDMLPDWWEWEQFQGEAAYEGTNDVDLDGLNNWYEYLADTDPLDSNSFFHITKSEGPASGQDPSIAFVSSTARVYTVECNTTSLTNASGWTALASPFLGDPSTTTWVDVEGSTNLFKFYRVRAQTP